MTFITRNNAINYGASVNRVIRQGNKTKAKAKLNPLHNLRVLD